MHTRKPLSALLALSALLLILGSQGLAAATLKVSPPELKIRQHQLANGMKVILHEDRSVPAVNVQVW
ncbi:MAG: insulinase family protein, partial [Thermoanaerobaculia bacterium]